MHSTQHNVLHNAQCTFLSLLFLSGGCDTGEETGDSCFDGDDSGEIGGGG